MSRRLTDEDHIERFFRAAKYDACVIQREKVDLIMRVRFPDLAPAKRGRPKQPRSKPPIAVEEPTGTGKTGSRLNARALGDESV